MTIRERPRRSALLRERLPECGRRLRAAEEARQQHHGEQIGQRLDQLDRHCAQPRQDRALLASCYRSCLQLAAEHGLESVAFCCISTGEFHFPNELAAEIAVHTIKEFLVQDTSVRKVIFNVFKDLDYEIYRRLLGAG